MAATFRGGRPFDETKVTEKTGRFDDESRFTTSDASLQPAVAASSSREREIRRFNGALSTGRWRWPNPLSRKARAGSSPAPGTFSCV
jgi:hypothetical protein